MLTITIPAPCHEDWNKMTPDKTGRHCSSCAKSVIDFTAMSDEEVRSFFLNKKEDEKVCGRFKQTQLHRIVIELPQSIFHIQMPLWKRFLAACLVVFSTTLFSCETKIKGEPETLVQTGDIKNNTGTEHVMVGGIGFSISPDTIPAAHVCPTTMGYSSTIIVNDMASNDVFGGLEFIEVDSARIRIPDTIPAIKQKTELIIMGDSIYEELPTTKTKTDSSANSQNPPKADSVNCNTIKNYN